MTPTATTDRSAPTDSGKANPALLAALVQLEDAGIPRRALLISVEMALEGAWRRAAGKRVRGRRSPITCRVDPEAGTLRVWQRRSVVLEASDAEREINLAQARVLEPDADLGAEIEVELSLGEFERQAAISARNVVASQVHEVVQAALRRSLMDRRGELASGVVSRRSGTDVLLDLGRVEAVLPASEQIQGEELPVGSRVTVLVSAVRMRGRTPEVVVSRTHPALVRRLLEMEVPELARGTVVVRALAREPGSRTKVAVSAREQGVDPIGACVGPRGARNRAVVEELRGERVDVISWDEQPERFVMNALAPARVVEASIDQAARLATCLVDAAQVSLAIGRGGENARLAARLTGLRIDIRPFGEASAAAAPPAEETLPETGAASGEAVPS